MMSINTPRDSVHWQHRFANIWARLHYLREGVFARECLGLTIQDGWGYAGGEAVPTHRGVAFSHHEDVIDAVRGLGLFFAFGAIGIKAAEDDAATLALGRQILSVLQQHGVPCSWSLAVKDRIRIAPFEWQRRRWTDAPGYERRQCATRVPKRPSLLSRILGRGATAKPSEGGENFLARECGAVVRALRNESGFNVRRAQQMRAAWQTRGNDGAAQVGHVGIPHVFVPPGDFTAMAPQLAMANLREENNEIFLRGVRSKAAEGG